MTEQVHSPALLDPYAWGKYMLSLEIPAAADALWDEFVGTDQQAVAAYDAVSHRLRKITAGADEVVREDVATYFGSAEHLDEIEDCLARAADIQEQFYILKGLTQEQKAALFQICSRQELAEL
jgi:hypothetical protein